MSSLTPVWPFLETTSKREVILQSFGIPEDLDFQSLACNLDPSLGTHHAGPYAILMGWPPAAVSVSLFMLPFLYRF